MKTEHGFDLSAILQDLVGPGGLKGFDEKCKSYTGGATIYHDPIHGEQSYHYMYANLHLEVNIPLARSICSCTLGCHCKSEIPYERIKLTEQQIRRYLEPTLF